MHHRHSQKHLYFLMRADNSLLQVSSVSEDQAKDPVNLSGRKMVATIQVFMQQELND